MFGPRVRTLKVSGSSGAYVLRVFRVASVANTFAGFTYPIVIQGTTTTLSASGVPGAVQVPGFRVQRCRASYE